MLPSISPADLSRSVTTGRELRFSSADPGTIEGYASTFGGDPDVYGDVIAKGAFAKSIAEFASSGRAPIMLWSHDPAEIIGRWTDLVEDEKGLKVKGLLNLDTRRGAEAQALLKSGDVSGLSIGFYTEKWAAGEGKVSRILQQVKLAEISVVGFPANSRARVTSAKSISSRADLVDLLRGAGIAKAAAQKIAVGGYAALQSQDETDVGELLQRMTAAAGELKSMKG